MGTCECVQTQNISFLQIAQAKTSNLKQVELKMINTEENGPEQQISFMTYDEEKENNFSRTTVISPKDVELRLTQSKISISRKSLHSIESNTNFKNEFQIEVFEKIAIKQYYQLKKKINCLTELCKELELKDKDFLYEKATYDRVYEQNFKKLRIVSSERDQICYFRGTFKDQEQSTIIQGLCEMYFENGAYYNGNIEDNRFTGTGIYIHPSKDYYIGQWVGSMANGTGQFHHYEGVIIKGKWVKDAQDGAGEEYWPDGAIFKGIYSKGEKKTGKFTWPNNTSYEGEIHMNKFQGNGVFVWQDKRSYDGSWKDNMMHGYGVFRWANGQVYQGEYFQDKKHGRGQLCLEDGVIINGKWVNGKLQGSSEVTRNGTKTKVRWKNGVEIKKGEKA